MKHNLQALVGIVGVVCLIILFNGGSTGGVGAVQAYCADYDGDNPLEPGIVTLRTVTTPVSVTLTDWCETSTQLVELTCDNYRLVEKRYRCRESVCQYGWNGAAYCGR